MKRVIIIRKLS